VGRTFKNPLCSGFFPAEGIAILLIGWTHKPSCGCMGAHSGEGCF